MKLLIAEARDFCPEALATLAKSFDIVTADLDRCELLERLDDIDVLWVRLRFIVDEEVIDAGRRLRVVATNTTGLNHIDLAAAERHGVRVVSLRGQSHLLADVRSTAELALGLLLAVVRRIPVAIGHVKGGGWDRDQFIGRELYQKTAGIVGYGRLGAIMARYLAALGMQVVAYDPRFRPETAEGEIAFVSLDELLTASDVVSIHAELNDLTHGLIGQSQFARMKRGACLINTARGELIDEAALLEALESGQLSAAALDVLCNESSSGMPDHPLVQYAHTHDNLIISPHIGGCSIESLHKTERILAELLIETIRSENVLSH